MKGNEPFDPATRCARRLRRLARRAALWTGGLTAGYALLGAGLAWAFLHNVRVPGQGTPADAGLEYETVTLTAPDGVRLKGWYVPYPGARAGIVVCHGYRANRQDMISLLPFLHRAGFAVLTFDFRAMGESEGRTCSFGRSEKGDVRAAVRFLRHRGIGPGQVGVLGLSMGGSTAILAAAEDPDIGAVVADSSFARLDLMVRQRFLQLGRAAMPFAGCTQWWAERMVGFPASSVSPVGVVRRLAPRPLLLIHGEADTYTPAAHSRALYAAAGEPKQLWVVPNAAHVQAHSIARDEYEHRVAAFFREALLRGAGSRRASRRE
jgi:dipeptidyl aminopeptidase/acylaminoacyl peptidase